MDANGVQRPIAAYGLRHAESPHAFYAPVGMTDDAYRQLLRNIQQPPENL